ncbi:hypothetical protein SASPL_116209 [Salvia splendens]|uniref:Uncharacterized protein n=1 Tax=Salvia splendens TaxID=180675 RepID=A0A8X8ZXR9_SALSN|nr:hypothetical protein SASPL_116209 [Salvia splendens]
MGAAASADGVHGRAADAGLLGDALGLQGEDGEAEDGVPLQPPAAAADAPHRRPTTSERTTRLPTMIQSRLVLLLLFVLVHYQSWLSLSIYNGL